MLGSRPKDGARNVTGCGVLLTVAWPASARSGRDRTSSVDVGVEDDEGELPATRAITVRLLSRLLSSGPGFAEAPPVIIGDR